MNAPDPKANTTTEAYLAYKAGYLEESELKPVLYEPYLHFDSWLAYWAGLTNTYPLDKNGDPEILTDEEALVAYLSGVTDTYPEEIKDPYDVRIVGYLKHLASIRWPEPDYPVNNEEFYLSTMEPTHTSNPEPSSDIELDTAEGKIIGVEAYGDTFQQTYSGKNLYDATRAESTYDGLTCSANNAQIYFNGQLGSTWSVNSKNMSLKAGTYKLMLQLVSGSITDNIDGLLTYFQGDNITTSPAYGYLKTGGKEKLTLTVTVSTDTANAHIMFYVRTQNVFNNAVIKYQLVAGSTEDWNFEPYVGGTASPNPDYPQDAQVVTGAQTVTVTGKNLFDNYQTPYRTGINFYNLNVGVQITAGSSQSVTTTATDNSVSMVSTGSWQGVFMLADIEDTKKYTFSAVATGTGLRLSAYTLDDTHTIVRKLAIGSTSGATFGVSFTAGSTEKYFAFAFGSSVASTIIVSNPQLELGSTSTTYEPYQGATYNVDLTGKNLLHIVGTTSNGLTSSNQNGILKVSGEATDNWAFVVPETNSSLSAGEYTLSIDNSLSHSVDVRFYFNDGTNQTYAIGAGNTTTNFATTKSANKYAVLFGGITNGQEYDETIELQLELGSTASEFAPYFEPIELCKIGDYQDYIYKEDDDWYVHKEIGKVLLTGSENWVLMGTNTRRTAYYTIISDIRPYTNSNDTPEMLSNYFTPVSENGTWVQGLMSREKNNSTRAIFCMNPSSFTTTTDFTTWLSSNNNSLYYSLATPTDTKITNSALIAQLDALAGADTYNEKTYIKVTTTDPNLPALLKVEAYKY